MANYTKKKCHGNTVKNLEVSRYHCSLKIVRYWNFGDEKIN